MFTGELYFAVSSAEIPQTDFFSVPDVIVNKNGVFIDTHVRYRTISDNLSKQEYKFLLTTTLTISEFKNPW